MAVLIRKYGRHIPFTPVDCPALTDGQFAASTTAIGSAPWASTIVNRGHLASDDVGKKRENATNSRRRLGYSFAIPAGVTAAQTGVLHIALSAWDNTLETFAPVIYVSNSDDNAYAGAWYNNINNGPYTGVGYGSLLDQQFSIPGAILAARAGSNLSLIIGTDLELSDSGATASSGNAACFSAVILQGAVLGVSHSKPYIHIA